MLDSTPYKHDTHIAILCKRFVIQIVIYDVSIEEIKFVWRKHR